MSANRSCLLVYNTVDRLLRGDLFHTVTTADVIEDLAGYSDDNPLVGIGTTSWLRRNGEVIAEGTTRSPKFLWADPESSPVGQVIDVCWQRPSSNGPLLVTPRLDANDQQANFPFLALAVCDPANVLHWDIAHTADAHEWLIAELTRLNVGVAGIQFRGSLVRSIRRMLTTFRLAGLISAMAIRVISFSISAHYQSDEWLINGVFAANPSLQPFISVANHPLHLHGYRSQERDGGHIVRAEVIEASVTVWPLDGSHSAHPRCCPCHDARKIG